MGRSRHGNGQGTLCAPEGGNSLRDHARTMRKALIIGLLVALTGVTGCGDDEPELWIYTSIYKSVIKRMTPLLAERFPGVRIRWYDKGSETIASKLNAEIQAGGSNCDLLMTSDPFYYLQLKEAGHLLAHESAAVAGVASFKDPDHTFATVRVPVMALAVNTNRLQPDDYPQSFKDLEDARFAGAVAMPDPLKSGTTFTTVAALSAKYGWSYFEALRKNDIVSAGGNSAVLNKIETGEKAVGIILMENVLPRIEKGAPLAIVVPSDGAIPVPSPVAILASTDQPALAKQVYDFMFSAEMQAAVVSGWMYSPIPSQAPPKGAPAWADLSKHTWSAESMAAVRDRRDEIKQTFRDIMR